MGFQPSCTLAMGSRIDFHDVVFVGDDRAAAGSAGILDL